MTFGSIRQVGYVVKDIQKAMKLWSETVGVGPWFYNEEVNTTEFRYYGKESVPPRLAIALANTGDTQIELIQQKDDAPSLYLDTLKRNGEIAQHVAYWTDDKFDEWFAHFIAHGYVEGHGGRMGERRGRFTYLLREDFPSAVIELSETTGGKKEYFDRIRQAAIDWDGADPIRSPTKS